MDFVWGPATATGIGSLPLDDRDEAARIVVGELPDFPHLPELPGRGAGADMIGRAASLLVDLHVDLQPSGWRLVDRQGADERRAASFLGADLDALEIAAFGYEGPLKVQVAGPLTLAASVELNRGGPAVSDAGARRDLAASLAEGIAGFVADVARRVPGGSVVLQLDEPSLPAVLAGSIPTVSGFGRLRAVDTPEASALVGAVVSAVGDVPVVVHCCAPAVPVDVVRSAGAVGVSLDVALLTSSKELDALATAVDAGLAVWPGVVPSLRPSTPPADRELAQRIVGLWRRLDQDPAAMAARTVVTPSCGLAGADPAWARRAYTLARTTARAFAELAGTS
ncbi:methionine synthase [Jiangella alkaliphila]|uniref:Cobalamin-independent synthase, Catalytic domain n=1 Tax=Jiangella alkaliphila TaxID=419479 RepID=A0A1H2LLG1_9ACTN|nr:methionine synthase [Jiangella alkaliphila]SDU81226.1 Cobalamin-independent synthase, Catalytic domain [Jiangella alkaliphila]